MGCTFCLCDIHHKQLFFIYFSPVLQSSKLPWSSIPNKWRRALLWRSQVNMLIPWEQALRGFTHPVLWPRSVHAVNYLLSTATLTDVQSWRRNLQEGRTLLQHHRVTNLYPWSCFLRGKLKELLLTVLQGRHNKKQHHSVWLCCLLCNNRIFTIIFRFIFDRSNDSVMHVKCHNMSKDIFYGRIKSNIIWYVLGHFENLNNFL